MNVSIGGAAAAAGVNVQTLHYYERRGLIGRPARTSSGYRQYSPALVRSVRAIKRLQGLGFTLREIQQLARIRTRGGSARVVGDLATRKLATIEEQIATLSRLRDRLRQVLATCACRGDLRRCDVLEGLGD